LQADLESGSLYAFLQGSMRLQIRHASQELQATLPTTAEAELLQMSRRHPVLAIDQTTYVGGDVDDVPAIVGRTVYRADRYRFRLQVPY
jgi:DNA-binding GntR family transcriptional regulator